MVINETTTDTKIYKWDISVLLNYRTVILPMILFSEFEVDYLHLRCEHQAGIYNCFKGGWFVNIGINS